MNSAYPFPHEARPRFRDADRATNGLGWRHSFLRLLLTIVALLGLYSSIGWTLPSGLRIPGIVVIGASQLLLLLNFGRLRIHHLTTFVLLVGIPAFTAIPAGIYRSLGGEFLKSWIQFMSSVVVFLSLGLEFSQWSAERISRFFGVAAALILVGCALENTTPLRGISDAFRQRVFADVFLYESELRDEMYFGGRRPCLFTQEPSHVAKFFAISFAIWFSTGAHNIARIMVACAGLLLGILLIGSVSILAAMPLAALGFVFSRRTLEFMRRNLVGFGFTVILGGLVLGGLYRASSSAFESRIEAALSGADFSTYTRLIAPTRLVTHVLSADPLFGVGLGGKELVESSMLSILVEGTTASSGYLASRIDAYWNNAFAELLIFQGILGTALMLAALILVVRKAFNGHWFVTLAALFVIANMDSGFVSFRVWAYLGCFLGAACVLKRESPQQSGVDPVPEDATDLFARLKSSAGHPETEINDAPPASGTNPARDF